MDKRRRCREEHHRWRGGSYVKQGYVRVNVGPRTATHDGYEFEHVVVAERVLGKKLPAGAVVHHVDEDTCNNRPENLVICEDRAYHALLHVRLRSLRECGDVTWRKCKHCGEYAPIEELIVEKNSGGERFTHRKCRYYHWTIQEEKRARKKMTRIKSVDVF